LTRASIDEEVLQVSSKWPFPPLTPTYDQYVQRWVTIPAREGFHVLSGSVMKALLETVKWMALHDKRKKRVLFKILFPLFYSSKGVGLYFLLSRVIVDKRVCILRVFFLQERFSGATRLNRASIFRCFEW